MQQLKHIIFQDLLNEPRMFLISIWLKQIESYSVHIISSNCYIDIMNNGKKHIALSNKK